MQGPSIAFLNLSPFQLFTLSTLRRVGPAERPGAKLLGGGGGASMLSASSCEGRTRGALHKGSSWEEARGIFRVLPPVACGDGPPSPRGAWGDGEAGRKNNRTLAFHCTCHAKMEMRSLRREGRGTGDGGRDGVGRGREGGALVAGVGRCTRLGRCCCSPWAGAAGSRTSGSWGGGGWKGGGAGGRRSGHEQNS